MHKVRFFILLCCFVASGTATAQTRIILLGGGAGPDSSELSIEKNVAWVSSILRQNGFNDFDVQFARGSEGHSDVIEKDPNKADLDKWLPLARVLGSKTSLMSVYRKNTVATLVQENTRENVIALIEKRLGESKPGDDLLIVYLGHGGHAPDNTDNNYLRLWGGTKLSMAEIIGLLQQQPQDVTLRFILPQCFSGAFVRLIHTDPKRLSLDNVTTNRCGFVTVPDNRQSEGCTVEDDESKYVDFSTYFFAPLSGKTRQGQPLEWDPDQNGDGAVDFREAYFYASMTAYSRDVPRATSEYFLELWEPWYVRWLPFKLADIENEYKTVAAHIAAKMGIPLQPGENGFMEAVLASRRQAELVYLDANERLQQAKKDEKKVKVQLKHQINVRWPQAKNAYTDSYLVFVDRDLADVAQWLLSQPAYSELAELQEKIEELEDIWLSAERDVGMNMRLQRAIYMAKLRHAFSRFGASGDHEKYTKLLECELWGGPAKNQ